MKEKRRVANLSKIVVGGLTLVFATVTFLGNQGVAFAESKMETSHLSKSLEGAMDRGSIKNRLIAAKAGDPKAQNDMAETYRYGHPQDFKNYEYWLRRSAEGDYAPAQFELGAGLGIGAGPTSALPHDRIEGMHWLLLARKHGG